MQTQITITIELSEADAAKYEATGEFRKPLGGEYYFWDDGKIYQKSHSREAIKEAFIFRPKPEPYKWPEWLKGWGFAMDKGGKIYWYEDEPSMGNGKWNEKESEVCEVGFFATLGIPIPTITDWTKPVINPNWKGE